MGLRPDRIVAIPVAFVLARRADPAVRGSAPSSPLTNNPTRKKARIMTVRQLAGTTAVVTGASRGFGRAISVSLVERGAHVVGVARTQSCSLSSTNSWATPSPPRSLTWPTRRGDPVDRGYRPQTVVLNAGATPPVGSLHEQTWEMFSTNWSVDVRHVFNFTREILTAPLDPGSVVVSLSSGAALGGHR